MKRTRLRARPKPKNYDEAAAERWFRAVCHKKAVCAVCRRSRGLQAHHAVPKSYIEDFASEERMDDAERNRWLWDARNGLALCVPCHERHTNAFRRVPRTALPSRAWEFAVEIGKRASRRGVDWALVRLENEYPPPSAP